jgi:hypothetical protein
VGCYHYNFDKIPTVHLSTMCLQSIVRYKFPSPYWDFNLNKWSLLISWRRLLVPSVGILAPDLILASQIKY